jgi:transposase InsO family protein
MDICGPIKYKTQSHYLVVAFERISRFLWTISLTHMPCSQELIEFVNEVKNVLDIRTVHTDQGSQSTSSTWQREMANIGIRITKSSPMYSQTNGISERVIQTIQEKIRTDVTNLSVTQKTSRAAELINRLPTSSTKFTPNEILDIVIRSKRFATLRNRKNWNRS